MAFVDTMAEILRFAQIEMTIYGYTFSFFDFAVWSCFAALVIWVVVRLL